MHPALGNGAVQVLLGVYVPKEGSSKFALQAVDDLELGSSRQTGLCCAYADLAC